MKGEKVKKMYELEALEDLKITEELYVIRVPGGWIFEVYYMNTNHASSVFVPFNNEFQIPDPNEKKPKPDKKHYT